MTENLNIDFEVPFHLIYHYYASGAISFSLNLLVVYLILFHSEKLDSFRFYLLSFQVTGILLDKSAMILFQITCIISDLNITIFMQPIGLFPICAGYCYGIFSRFFSWSSHVLMTLFVFLLSGQIEALTICFLRKHKAIMNLGNMSRTSDWKYPLTYVLCISYNCVYTLSIYLSGDSHEEQMKVLEELYPETAPKFRALREFHYYIMNERLLSFFVLTTFGAAKTTILVSISVIRMYRTLQKHSSRMSRKTLARHKLALRSLIMQFLSTPISIFPGFTIMLTVIFPSHYSQQISWYSLMIGTTHSIFNCIVVIFTYPEFRKAVFFWKNDIRKLVIPNMYSRLSSIFQSVNLSFICETFGFMTT
ncbi:hypothetical protein CRE_06432 [Caenorhabditis remanei]|uniref:Serpentine Receptor, class I n=1 Tax=Caenorhabditis remanei TaxID=31234 RepID=E3M0W1_CAERE|nr:hypothetical protein CRE_06432 [Caenorhabditis remanei]